jgi:hypothetical protein
LRAAGVAKSPTPENVQVFSILMREIASRLLESVARYTWAHLTGGNEGAIPDIEVRLAPLSGVPPEAVLRNGTGANTRSKK